MTAQELGLVQACEERIVNCWPAVETLIVGDFVVRFANGYSGRANSATPLRAEADLDEATLDHIEARYRGADLPPVFRLTPLAAPGLAARLEKRGYILRDASLGMIAPLRALPAPETAISIADRPEPAWLDGVSRLQGGAKSNPAHLEAIVGRIRVPAGFATIFRDGEALGFGMTAIDRGFAEIGSIIIAPEARGQGFGRRLVEGLLHRAAQAGAHSAFLQVDVTNLAAIALYETLGFTRLYSYRTMIQAAA